MQLFSIDIKQKHLTFLSSLCLRGIFVESLKIVTDFDGTGAKMVTNFRLK